MKVYPDAVGQVTSLVVEILTVVVIVVVLE